MIGPYYRPQLTSVLSFLHRITGIVLAGAGVAVAVGLLCLAHGESAFLSYAAIMGGMLGKVLLLGFVFSLWFHFCNGIRHLGWDIGWGFDLDKTYLTGWLVVAGSIGLTVLTGWFARAALFGGAQ
jgi:succinate dehydrogenase / fumarate reductase cytochrome b subunit